MKTHLGECVGGPLDGDVLLDAELVRPITSFQPEGTIVTGRYVWQAGAAVWRWEREGA